ncbi:MAG: hypothetical protein JSV01_07485 [Desulfobacterales bacterium]|nr:MAG: hypothetical protein JSV01_07485 [Desulfobacterales bacterium]UCG80101.1 MAG: hypothetical protein JSV60_09040 [Desulfobacterales bacterium]
MERALVLDPGYLEALVFKGDISYDQGKRTDSGSRRRKYEALALEAYRTAADSSRDKNFQAMMYFKTGNVYADLSNDRQRATEYWQRSVSTAPNSKAARLAGERL